EQSTQALLRGPESVRLRLKLPPTFAIRWLVPRLARFHALRPGIDVQITTSCKAIARTFRTAVASAEVWEHLHPFCGRSASCGCTGEAQDNQRRDAEPEHEG
ncbi:MAG: hypothetical protein H0T52_08240, partial [Lautropia sp.]|nr:hypothetical protein [Lautropia sp.]